MAGEASRKVRYVDETLRDGQQCLWATRMTTGMMLPIAENLDRAGFHAIELMGAVHFDTAIRYLGENPWERMRLMKRHFRRTPLQGIIRSACVLGFDVKPADINELWVRSLLANGVDRLISFDGLHDFDNVVPNLKLAKSLGATTLAWLIFSDSPVHTDALYVAKAKEIIDRAGVDEILIQDTSGILTPERAATLIPALKGAIGARPLGLHSHSLVGLPQRTYLEALRCGVDTLYTCIPPLGDGAAPPSLLTTRRNLHHYGYEDDIVEAEVAAVQRHLEAEAALHGLKPGRPQDFDAAQFHHQIPGGVLSNLVAQLRTLGLEQRLDAVLEECGRVRAELGWPIQVTPFAQFMVVQATLNLLKGERYAVVPDEVKKYAFGYYGKLLAPVEPEVLDRISQRGSKAIAETPPQPEPAVERLRRSHPGLSDEELLLHYSFPENLMAALGKERAGNGGAGPVVGTPLATLARSLLEARDTSYFFLRNGELQVEFTRNES